MTKPSIPKEIPKERPMRISPGIPVVPRREPERKPRYVPQPERKQPVEVPVYSPNDTLQDILYSAIDSNYKN